MKKLMKLSEIFKTCFLKSSGNMAHFITTGPCTYSAAVAQQWHITQQKH